MDLMTICKNGRRVKCNDARQCPGCSGGKHKDMQYTKVLANDTLRHLKRYIDDLRENADMQDDDNEGKQRSSDLRLIAGAISTAIEINKENAKLPARDSLMFAYNMVLTALRDSITEFKTMTMEQKIMDRGYILDHIYHIQQAERLLYIAKKV